MIPYSPVEVHRLHRGKYVYSVHLQCRRVNKEQEADSVEYLLDFLTYSVDGSSTFSEMWMNLHRTIRPPIPFIVTSVKNLKSNISNHSYHLQWRVRKLSVVYARKFSGWVLYSVCYIPMFNSGCVMASASSLCATQNGDAFENGSIITYETA